MLKVDINPPYIIDLYNEASVPNFAAICLEYPQDQYNICSIMWFHLNVDI